MQIYIKICKLKQGCFEYYRKKTQETTPGATVHIKARIRNERKRAMVAGAKCFAWDGWLLYKFTPGRSMFNDTFTSTQ